MRKIYTNSNRETSGEIAPAIITDAKKGTELQRRILHHERIDTLLTADRMEAMRPINKEDGAHTIDGIGERILNIPLRDYLDWDQKYEGCWHDNGFLKEWKRDNPDSRPIKEPRSRKVTVRNPRNINGD